MTYERFNHRNPDENAPAKVFCHGIEEAFTVYAKGTHKNFKTYEEALAYLEETGFDTAFKKIETEDEPIKTYSLRELEGEAYEAALKEVCDLWNGCHMRYTPEENAFELEEYADVCEFEFDEDGELLS